MQDTEGGKSIYRFKYSESFIELISSFAKIHEYDDRPTFKDAWKGFVEENESEFTIETRKLLSDGFEGNVEQRMYRSARYYFRKKKPQMEAKKRREYIQMNHEIILLMDDWIERNITVKPAVSYETFLTTFGDKIECEVSDLNRINNLSKEEIYMKFKKTYKNRYFNKVKN